MKILMVCLGNICRSPMAEGIMKAKIEEHGLSWTVDSAGTGHWHVGEKPDKRAQETAQNFGLDISHQRARQFSQADFHMYDKIYTMDYENYKHVLSLAPSLDDHLKVDMILNASFPNKDMSVPDPYYDNGFETVFQMLDNACDAIIANNKH